jgi:hypothetical protein
MPAVEWSLLCEYCIIDHAGKLSLIGIFDRMIAVRLPIQYPLLFVVTRWRAESDRFTAQTRIWTPTEQLLADGGSVEVVAAGDAPHVTINQFHGLTFERAGQYLVELLAEGETARYFPWQVVLQPPPA